MEKNFVFQFEYNQKEAIERGWDSLDCTDLVIYGFLKLFAQNPKKVTQVDGVDYFWVTPKFLIEQLPTTRITSERNMRRRLDNLVKAGALLKLPDSHNYPSFAIAEGGDKSVRERTKMSARVDKNVRAGWTNLSDDNNMIITSNDNNNKKEKYKKEKSGSSAQRVVEPADFVAAAKAYGSKVFHRNDCVQEWIILEPSDKAKCMKVIPYYVKDELDNENEKFKLGFLRFLNERIWESEKYKEIYTPRVSYSNGHFTVYDEYTDETRPHGTRVRDRVWDAYGKIWRE